MTVTDITPVVTYINVGPKDYTFSFLTFALTDITVRHISDTGEITELVASYNYDVYLTPDQTSEGGYVTTYSTVPDGGNLQIARILPIDQPVDWLNNGPLDADVLERSMDRLTMMMQQVDTILTGQAAVISWRGDWLPNTDYIIKDMVIDPDTGNWYYCLDTHTSSTDLDADIAAGYWLLALDMALLNSLVEQAAQSEAIATAAAESALASEEVATAAAEAASDSEANAAMSEINAANCATEANQSAAEAKQYRDEAAAIIAAGKVVEVVDENYFTANPGQTTFPINPPTPQQYMIVFMNSRKLRAGEDFTTDTPLLATNVVLTTPADAGDEIDVTLFNSIDGSA